MLILTPELVSKEINYKLKKVVGEEVSNPHITLGKPFHSTKRDIRRPLESWLMMQSPFRFNLDTVDYFSNGVVYLTSGDEDQRERLKDWFYGIKSVTNGGIEENIGFNPHLTLIRHSNNPRRDTEILKDEFDSEIGLEIKTIKLFRGVNGECWENLGEFSARNLSEEYLFSDTGRASIVY